MDFIALATHGDPRHILRTLDEIWNDDDEDPTHTGDVSATIYSYLQNNNDEPVRAPLLSKTAEAELYLLATNFLLYVALVIVTTLVAKIYFPEFLQRDNTTVWTPRSFKYRVAMQESENFYASDEDEEEDENRTTTEEQQQGEGWDSDSSDRADRRRAYDFMEPNERLSKVQVLRRLVFCSLMLNATFVLWGLIQERMLTRRYPRYVGEYFTYSYALVFTNRFWTLVMSGMLMLYLKPRSSRTTVIYEYSFPAISNMLSSWCQYESLRYASFPATTLFKSFKLAPVMLMGKLLGNKTYPQYDYLVALMIGVGITMFMTSTDDLRFGINTFGYETNTTTWTGIMLLFLFLFFDSFTSQFQSRMFQRHRDLSMVELMFATSAFSTVLSLVTLIHSQELYPALSFVRDHSEIHVHFLLFSICSTIGQLFIYYTIKNFGAVVFTIIMTTRILLSIALSCILYGHKVSATGFFGLCLVMAAVLYRIKQKAQGQQLLKWQGMEDNAKDHELVQEWHEHVDM